MDGNTADLPSGRAPPKALVRVSGQAAERSATCGEFPFDSRLSGRCSRGAVTSRLTRLLPWAANACVPLRKLLL